MNDRLSEGERTRKVYIFPHKHCLYCGKMLESKGRPYCLKCKPVHEKQQAMTNRNKKVQKILIVYTIAVVAVSALIALLLHV